MPKFKVTDPQSGQSLILTGGSPPSEQELNDIFASQPKAAAPDPARSVLAIHPVPHTGYAEQVRQMALTGPDKGTTRPIGQIGQSYADIIGGAATGVPAGAAGLPGDVESLTRNVAATVGAPVSRETVLPTSEDVGNMIAGPAANQDVAAGRKIGNLLGPAAGAKFLKAGSGFVARSVAGGGPTDAAKAAHDAGYVLPPNMASERPGPVSDVLNAAGGKIKTQQTASIKNQATSNKLAAQDVGLPSDEQITPDALEGVRSDAGKSYEAIRKAPIDIILGDKFKQSVANLNQAGAEARSEAPELVQNPEIDQLSTALLSKDKLSPAATVDLVRSLRYKAQTNLKNYTSPEKMDLGRAQSKAATALEGALEDNLQAATTARAPIGAQGGDMTAMLADLKNARQTIAKTYDIEKALTPAGNINAQKMAQIGTKRPLSGGLRTIADMGANFPKAAQPAERIGGNEKFSIVDTLAALATGGKTAALSLARPVVRRGMLSSPYQNLLMKEPPAPGIASGYVSKLLALPNAVRPESSLNRPVDSSN